MRKVAVIDNFDSFTYNLVHYLEALDANVNVFRNDQIDYNILSGYDYLLLSPGPGLPKLAGDLMKVISTYYKDKSILGVCLGHQAIAQFFNYELINMKNVLHGKTSELTVIDSNCLFKGLPEQFKVGHYHSWNVENLNKDELIPTAYNDNDMVMAFRHCRYRLYGVQFHPESVLTENGLLMLKNWLEIQ